METGKKNRPYRHPGGHGRFFCGDTVFAVLGNAAVKGAVFLLHDTHRTLAEDRCYIACMSSFRIVWNSVSDGWGMDKILVA